MALHVAHLEVEIAGRTLLHGATFHVGVGQKVALVGANGAGKTSLLRTIAGQIPAAGGTIRLPTRYGWLAQDTMASAAVEHVLAYDHLLAASPLVGVSKKLGAAQVKMQEATAARDDEALDSSVAQWGELEEHFRLSGGYELESSAERIAQGLGLDEEALLVEVGALSGGKRRRLELARLLLAGGDLLILDEPTNHLDAEAKAFVMDFLRTSPSAVLVVSHDIELMNESIDRVLALENAQIEVYRGTYSEFQKKRAQRETARERETANAQKEVVRLQQTADKFRQGNATSARRRKALEQRIGRITDGQALRMPAVRRRPLKVRFPDPVRAGDVVLTVEGVGKGFGGEPVLEDVTFGVGRGEVFLVVGPNGAGKTTLLRCIAGLHEPDSGHVAVGANVTVGFYAQEHEDIPPGKGVLELMLEAAAAQSTVADLRSILAHFGLTGDVAEQEAATLSGGEKTKLSLARLVGGRANCLLLDEPTNNLDSASREAVLGALQHYKGTVVLVSHDLDFVAQLAPKHAIVMPSGKLMPFDERMLQLVPETGPPTPAATATAPGAARRG
ncbi:MAG TPA: ABC-F family ATP-binding cassette domain-containing protein [Acidimicrobiales bacterium]|nr:ABC-F family ATP-binding cassette domain-containing protein [Acidimicrobiales bacterium]